MLNGHGKRTPSRNHPPQYPGTRFAGNNQFVIIEISCCACCVELIQNYFSPGVGASVTRSLRGERNTLIHGLWKFDQPGAATVQTIKLDRSPVVNRLAV